MSNKKELIKKLFSIAEKQQKIITKLAQATNVPPNDLGNQIKNFLDEKFAGMTKEVVFTFGGKNLQIRFNKGIDGTGSFENDVKNAINSKFGAYGPFAFALKFDL